MKSVKTVAPVTPALSAIGQQVNGILKEFSTF